MNAQKRRMEILTEMASIPKMAKGKLTAEYRAGMRKGKATRLGPYYKYQIWENGRNVSRRIPTHEAASLQEGVDGYQRYLALSEEFSALTVSMGGSKAGADVKKKS